MQDQIDFINRPVCESSPWVPTSPSDPKDGEESLRVSNKIRAFPKQCWFNARKVIMRLPEYAEASYVEGWAVFNDGFSIEHGWIAKEGNVIDPTLPLPVMTYFPGLEFKGRAGIDEFLATKDGKKCKRSPFFFAFGWGGMASPSFRKAYDAALALSLSLFTGIAE